MGSADSFFGLSQHRQRDGLRPNYQSHNHLSGHALAVFRKEPPLGYYCLEACKQMAFLTFTMLKSTCVIRFT
jgi:hypothetical protein